MATTFPAHSGTTPLFLLVAEARAFIAKEEPPEYTKAQLKALARKALEAKGEPIHHRCEADGCTAVITDIDLTTQTVRTLCWEHSGPHRRRRKDGQKMHCPCGSSLHAWCSTASLRMGPNKPGARPIYAQVLA